MKSRAQQKAEHAAVKKIRERSELKPPEYYTDGILRGDRVVLSQALTIVESTSPLHRTLSSSIVSACLPHSGNSLRIGITGVPGVGKSTFIEAFGAYLIGNQQKKIAVLAIDPSSPVSGGSILGDKTRMEKLATETRAFIRPSPSANSFGGVARKTREAIVLCEAAGFDCILVETVGVGQSETTVHNLTDFFLLLMLAGAGDQLQGIKRGIMEMCDGILITKADGDNASAAKRARTEYFSALHLFAPSESGWKPRVEICSAITNTGIDHAWSIIHDHEKWMKERNLFDYRRSTQDLQWMHNTIKDNVLANFFSDSKNKIALSEAEKLIKQRKISPFDAAEKLVKQSWENLRSDPISGEIL
ncbi:MAG: methylmalonyl Co-A mutase-associated GTPase MeaB [Crocinitomicaceae bacterium]|nr:methylmalonyl Co-A mutase-associated GTPase MeaB [Crocinitomicaceae bacterium]